MPHSIHKKLVYLKYLVLAATVILVFLATHGVVVGVPFFDVEPFSALFILIGDDMVFIFLVAMLVSSLFYNRFYCSYICPAGAGLSLAGRLRIKEIKRWPECDVSEVCEIGCPTGAISAGRISTLECTNCRTCEAKYLDTKICQHYAWKKIGRAAQT